MRFTVGGEEYELTKERVIRAMQGAASEPIHKHLVEVDGEVFPPKQVFATVTGRARMSFTTMEAQRVLRRLGFLCLRTEYLDRDAPTSVAAGGGASGGAGLAETPTLTEARLATLEAAVAGLHGRVRELEAARRIEVGG